MAEPKPGDRIEVATEDEKLVGTLMASPELEKDTLILKLDSGYNLGILRSKVRGIRAVPEPEPEQKKTPAHEALPKAKPGRQGRLPCISILHTGGTIASKVDYRTGGVIAKFSEEEMAQMFPELQQMARIRSRAIARFQSEMARFPHYNLIAKEVEKEIAEGAEGVIVTHGTDTLHYTSAALSFMLENLPVPVLLVGAQRSSDRGSSDASANLLSAVYFAAHSDFSGVALCMHENSSDDDCLILPALKSRKMHTSRRDAFRPINTKPIARVNHAAKKVSFLQKKYAKRDGKRALKLSLINEGVKVALLKTHTNMRAEQFLAYKGYDGLVVEGTGLGHLPNEEIDAYTAENRRIHEAVAELVKTGTVVVMAPQTIYGRLQLNVYTPQREIQSIGVLGHLSDMTPETTFIKLAWLLSNYSKEETRKLITENLRGEISDRSEHSTFLI